MFVYHETKAVQAGGVTIKGECWEHYAFSVTVMHMFWFIYDLPDHMEKKWPNINYDLLRSQKIISMLVGGLTCAFLLSVYGLKATICISSPCVTFKSHNVYTFSLCIV